LILVDTTVWIDYFAGKKTSQAEILTKAIQNSDDICVCGLVLTETLQGIRHDNKFNEVKAILENLIYLPITKEIFIKSASVYRSIRKHGKTIRSPIDCMIASICIEHEVHLLHNDKDYNVIAQYTNLRIQK
jgi:predicted nucleic acid-binding protein